MLNKRNRISSVAFPVHTKRGRVLSSASFSMRVTRIASVSKMAVVVSKKVARTAVARNRIRRRLYHILRDLVIQRDAKLSIVLYVRADISGTSYADLRRECDELLTRAV